MKHAFLIILLLSLMLILCSCGGNTEPPLPPLEKLLIFVYNVECIFV